MRNGLWLGGWVLCLAAGCGGQGGNAPVAGRQAGDRVERPGQPTVTHIEEGDEKMNAAMKKAADSIDDFIKALDNPTPKQEMFAIKVGVGAGETLEFMWLSPVEYKAGVFQGELNNEPIHPQKYKLGDRITVPKAEAVDWMYSDDGYMVGGYTVLVLRDTLPPNERAEFDAGLPMKIR